MKNSWSLFVVSIPISVGTNFLSFLFTYPLSIIVLIVVAYVDGLPIPRLSISLINELSVYLAGGSVKCCFVSTLSVIRLSDLYLSKSGKILSSLFSNSLYTFK